MKTKPIGPLAHGVIDYGYSAIQALAPSLFGLKGSARSLCYGFAATQGIVSTLTDYPLGNKTHHPFSSARTARNACHTCINLAALGNGSFKERQSTRLFSGYLCSLAGYLSAHRLPSQ